MLNSNETQFESIGTRQLLSNIPDDMTINFDGNYNNNQACQNIGCLF